MENASRALIMAASTMIALMILACMIYLFRQGALLNEHYDRSQISRNLELYNSKFLQFDRSDNSFSDIISLCNLAYDVNVGTEYSPTWAVQVEFSIGGVTYVLTSNAARAESVQDYKRNYVFKGKTGNEIISLYDMAQMAAGPEQDEKPGLNFTFDEYSTKVTPELLGTYQKYKITESRFFSSFKQKADGSYTNVSVVKQEPVFLFAFVHEDEGTGYDMYNDSGRVKLMKFKCVLNEHELVSP